MSYVPALVISPRDNVATALEPLEAGRIIAIANESITVAEETPRGHKIALRLIRKGEEVVKYGSTIGTASRDIQPGAHVHTHNVVSGRGRGDLTQRSTRNEADVDHGSTRNDQAGPRMNTEAHGSSTSEDLAAEPRIAEPPDLSPVTGKTVQ